MKYSRYFNDPSKVIEFGSAFANGSIRDHFNCSDYTGIDWREDRDVDLVSFAHEVPFDPQAFDTVVSASMLEHDPYWEKSLAKMVEALKPDGLFAISWGAALNRSHSLPHAPDGKFHALQSSLVLGLLKKLNMYIHEFQYERNVLQWWVEKENDAFGAALLKHGGGFGEVILVAFKDKKYSIGESLIDDFIPEDMI